MEAQQTLQGRGATCDITQQSAGCVVCVPHYTHISFFLFHRFKSYTYRPLFCLISLHSFVSSFYIPYAVGIVTGYRLNDQGIALRFPTDAEDFSSSPKRPYRFWGPPSFLYTGYHT
jgi:hypothetical protein